jgi:hypothetical protein
MRALRREHAALPGQHRLLQPQLYVWNVRRLPTPGHRMQHASTREVLQRKMHHHRWWPSSLQRRGRVKRASNRGMPRLGCALLALGAGCSLLAPSYDDATRGLRNGQGDGAMGSGGEDSGAMADGTSPATSSDARSDQAPTPPCAVPAGCQSCNLGECAGCGLVGSPCHSNASCCGGRCDTGTRLCLGSSPTSCRTAGDSCSSPSKCCAGLTCAGTPSGHCQNCHVDGLSCTNDSDCCSQRCVGTSCGTCIDNGAPCDPSTPHQCCGGLCLALDGGTPRCFYSSD